MGRWMLRWLAAFGIIGLMVLGWQVSVHGLPCWGNPASTTHCMYPFWSSLAAPLPPTVVPQPAGTVHVLQTHTIRDGSWVYVVGEVENGATTPAAAVQLHAQFYDTANRAVIGQDYDLVFPVVFAGQRVPFKLALSNAPPDTVRGDVTITASATTTPAPAVPLTVEAPHFTRDANGIYRVAGIVRNTTTTAAGQSAVAVTFYDAAGAVVYVSINPFIAAALAPRQYTDFTVTDYLLMPFDHLTVQAQGASVR